MQFTDTCTYQMMTIFYVDTCSRYDYCYFMNLSFLLYLKRCKFYLKLLHEEGQIIMARFKENVYFLN